MDEGDGDAGAGEADSTTRAGEPPQTPKALSAGELRGAAQKLNQVLTAADEAALERLRKRRLAIDDISLDDLRELRGLLESLAMLIEGRAPTTWSRLAASRRALAPPAVEAAPEASEQQTTRVARRDDGEPRLEEPERLDRPAEGAPTFSKPAEKPAAEEPPAAHAVPPRDGRPSLSEPADDAVRRAKHRHHDAKAAASPARAFAIDDEGTYAGDDGPPGGALPFRPASPWNPDPSSPPRPSSPPSASDAPPPKPPRQAPDDLTMAAIFLPASAPLPFAPLPFAPLPFAEAAPRPVEQPGESDAATRLFGFTSLAHPLALTVEEYAGLCAERDLRPAAALAAERRFGIHDAPTREAVDDLFKLLFAADPDAFALWENRYARFSHTLSR